MAEVITGRNSEEGSNNLGLLLLDSPELPLEPQNKISNLELCTALLVLARNNLPQPQKRYCAIREPNLFSRRSPDKLQAFIFQCQIYFRACEKEFREDSKKIFFAISYLRGIALDYFEPFINKLDPHQLLDFLEDWTAFVQQLSNVFGSYSLEDNNEDAIMAISFPHNEKASNYFIQFAKYQNQIH